MKELNQWRVMNVSLCNKISYIHYFNTLLLLNLIIWCRVVRPHCWPAPGLLQLTSAQVSVLAATCFAWRIYLRFENAAVMRTVVVAQFAWTVTMILSKLLSGSFYLKQKDGGCVFIFHSVHQPFLCAKKKTSDAVFHKLKCQVIVLYP